MRSEVQSGLEIRRRSVGRVALRVHRNTRNGVQGDMGWSSLQNREAISKWKFDERSSEMDDTQWARKVLEYLYMKSVNTKWTKQT